VAAAPGEGATTNSGHDTDRGDTDRDDGWNDRSTRFRVKDCLFFDVTAWFNSIAQVWALVVSNDRGLNGLARRLQQVPAVFVPFTIAGHWGRAHYSWGQLCAVVDDVNIAAPCEAKHQLEVRLGTETLRLGSLQGLFANAVRDLVQYIIEGDPRAAAPFIVMMTTIMNSVFSKYGSTARILTQWQDLRTVASVKLENRFGIADQKYTGEKRQLTERQKSTGL